MSQNVRDRILESVHNMEKLPAIPAVLARLKSEVERPQADPTSVAKIIDQDPDTAARVVRLLSIKAFAPKLSGTDGITIHMAAVRLGVEALRDVALAANALYSFHLSEGCTELEDLWKHSLAVGFAAQVLIDHCQPPPSNIDSARVFLAGLCHDIGKIALATSFPDEYEDIVELAQEGSLLMIEAEHKLIEVGHDEIGALFASRWGMPSDVCDAIRWHHDPEDCPSEDSSPLVRLVELANFVCNHQALGNSGNARVPDLPHAAFKALGIATDNIAAIVNEVQEKAVTANELMSLG